MCNLYKSVKASALISFVSGFILYGLTKMDVLEILALMTLIYIGCVTVCGLIIEELTKRRNNNMISKKKIAGGKNDLGA